MADHLRNVERVPPPSEGPVSPALRLVLEIVAGRDRGQVFEIVADHLDLGRGVHESAVREGRGIRLADSSVSRDHAALVWDAKLHQYRLVNRSTTNPACLNGKQVEQAFLEEGDDIWLGLVVLKVRFAPTLPEPEPRPRVIKPIPRRAPDPEKGLALVETSRVPAPFVTSEPTVFVTPSSRSRATARVAPRDEPPSDRVPPGRRASERRGHAPDHGTRAPAGQRPLRPGRSDLAQLFGQLGMMLDVGIVITRALGNLATRGSTPAICQVSERLLGSVSLGKYLSQAMAECGVFSRLHVHAVEAGEKSGRLPLILKELARWEERDLSLTRALSNSMIYPTTVLGAGILLVFVLGNRVFSALGPALTSSGKPLPLVTRMLFAASDVLQRPLMLFLVALALGAAVFALVSWIRTEKGRLAWDRHTLEVPLFGSVMRKIFVARFCNHLSLLHSAGIPLLLAMETCVAIVSNSGLRLSLQGATRRMRDGDPLSDCLAKTGQFPRLAIGLIAVGETTGNLDVVLKKATTIYDQEAYDALDAGAKMLEPLAISILGAMVSVIVLGTLLPLYSSIAV